MNEKPKVSPAEMDVLREVMDHEPVTLRTVADLMTAKKGLALTTVQTLLVRLQTKGYVKRDQVDGVWQYSLNVVRPTLEKSLVDDFVENMLGGSLSPFFAYLNEKGSLAPAEQAALESLIQKIEKEQKK